MTTLQARCRFCAHEDLLDIDDVLLVTPADPMAPARVVYDCTECVRRTSVAINASTAAILEARGARVVRGHPTFGSEARSRSTDPPLTYDDLLALHELLDTPDWFDRLLEATKD